MAALFLNVKSSLCRRVFNHIIDQYGDLDFNRSNCKPVEFWRPDWGYRYYMTIEHERTGRIYIDNIYTDKTGLPIQWDYPKLRK